MSETAKAKPWFVTPAVQRVDLSDGEWVELKNELTIGETKDILSRSTKYVRVDDLVVGVRDDAIFDTEFALAHLLRWSLTDDQGLSLELTRDAVLALKPERYREITKALSTVTSKRGEEKNGRSSKRKPSS